MDTTATIPAQLGILAYLHAAGIEYAGLWPAWTDGGYRWTMQLLTVDDAVRVLRLAALYRWEVIRG